MLESLNLVMCSCFFFFLSLFGFFLIKTNLIKVLMFIELLLLSCSLLFLVFYLSAPIAAVDGFCFPLLIITVAATESAIGLALIILIFKKYQTIYLDYFTYLRN